MRASSLLALAAGAIACVVSCLQVAGVQDIAFVAGDGGPADGALTDGSVEGSGNEGASMDGGADAAADSFSNADAEQDAASLPTENCPICNGVMCCSPKHCDLTKCCSDRAGPCTTADDCCNGQCDVDAGRCTGACLGMGAGPCVTGSDCCQGSCNSAGVCAPCQDAGGGCTSDIECCFGLGCTSSEAGVCMMF